MPRYLIELHHDDEHEACVRALHAIQQYGSHLVTHCEWGCRDGVHSGWLMAECETRAQALSMVPPDMRGDARIVKLDQFTPEEIVAWVEELES